MMNDADKLFLPFLIDFSAQNVFFHLVQGKAVINGEDASLNNGELLS